MDDNMERIAAAAGVEGGQNDPIPSGEDAFHDALPLKDHAADDIDIEPEGDDSASAAAGDAPESPLADTQETMKVPPISPIVRKEVGTSSLVRKAASISVTNQKMKFPTPFPDLIYGFHINDVLSGRGATVNAHPGNKRFREVCAQRKPEFEAASLSGKRQIALEIVESVMNWNPPGRFIERVDNNSNAKCSPEEVAAFFREVDVEKVLVGSSAAYFHEMGYTFKKDKRLKRMLGPWRDMGIERAIQKACGVIRDYKRPDRIALRAMGMLKKRSEKNDALSHHDNFFMPMQSGESYLPPIHGHTEGISMQDLHAGIGHDDDMSTAYKDIIPTPNDVLIGRGAFINKYIGNRQFRHLAQERRLKFESASPAHRRDIAVEIVTLTRELNPPGRFLKRAPYALQEPAILSDGNYQLPPRGLEGPWEEVSDEKAIAKALQVLRDTKVAPFATFNAYTKDNIEEQALVGASRGTPNGDSMDEGEEIPEPTSVEQEVGIEVGSDQLQMGEENEDSGDIPFEV